MAEYGILVDYEWCTGCHTCEVACQMEQGLPAGQFGIKTYEVGPWEIVPDVWQYTNMPVFTDQCDLCAERTSKGKLPTCVHHCQAKCLTYGPVAELAQAMVAKPKQALFYPTK